MENLLKKYYVTNLETTIKFLAGKTETVKAGTILELDPNNTRTYYIYLNIDLDVYGYLFKKTFYDLISSGYISEATSYNSADEFNLI